MHNLSVIKLPSGCYVDSREVASIIEKRHDNLLRDIAGYVKVLKKSNVLNFEGVKFFLESTYIDAKGETRPRYLISKMGCELVANKLIGEKGILFTAAYVSKFNEMEQRERDAQKNTPSPRLGEYNAAARLITRAMRDIGATSEQIIGFIKRVYEPLGISIALDELGDIPQMYTAKQIAKMLGVYSYSANPHYQAIAAILNENILIGDRHKSVITMDYGDHIGISIRYDDYAVNAVRDWIIENGYPGEIYGFERAYHVLYYSKRM